MNSSDITRHYQTDTELLHLIVEQGDQFALESLIEKHSTLLMSVCLQILRDKNDAEDAFQNTVINFVKSPEKIKKPQYFTSWLYKVAQRESYDLLRQKKRTQAESLVDHPAAAIQNDSSHSQNEELISLHEELEQLPEKYRVPLILCYLEGMSRKEAALELNITVNSIKASLANGRNLLRKRLLKRGIALASVLAAWNTSKAIAAQSISSSLITVTLNSQFTGSTIVGATSSAVSGISSNTILSKGAVIMAVCSKKLVVAGVAGVFLILYSIFDLVQLDNNVQRIPPVQPKEIVSKHSETEITEEIVSEKADPRLTEIIKKIREKEPIYQDLDITMHFREDHSLMRKFPNPVKGVEERNVLQKVHQKLRRVSQDSMYRIEFHEIVDTMSLDIHQDGHFNNLNQVKNKYQAQAFDGKSVSTVAVSQDKPILQLNPNPYQIAFESRLGKIIQFSDLLQGDEYTTQTIEKNSKGKYPKSIKYHTRLIEETELNGEPAVLVELIRYYVKSSKTQVLLKQRMYLASNRNYIPMKWQVFSGKSNTPLKTYEVFSWVEHKEGVWFPESAEMRLHDGDKSRRVSYNFEVETLNPEYPESFFKVAQLEEDSKNQATN